MTDPAEVQEIEFDDVELDVEEYQFDVIDDPEEEFVDVRDFVDRCFNGFSQTQGMVRRPIRKIVCSGNEEPEIARDGEIAVLLSYKSAQGRGRKSVLAGEDVLHISMPNGDFRIPLKQAEKFGKYLVGIARSANRTVYKGMQQANDWE
jgi:hypothetical protein